MGKATTFWVAAHNTGDSGGFEPPYARFTVDARKLARLTTIDGVVNANGLTEARVVGHPDSWGPLSEDDDQPQDALRNPEIVFLGKGKFYFTDYEDRDTQDLIETNVMRLDDILTQHSVGGNVFLGDAEALRKAITDCGDTELLAHA